MTLPANVPADFKDALVEFARTLKRNFAAPIEANPEDQLKAPTQALLQSMRPKVQPRTEAQLADIHGRPDIGVAVQNLLCGYVELKAPGKGARVQHFVGEDKKQWNKFKVLPNIVYTDSSEWALYRSGELCGDIVRFGGDVTKKGPAAFDDKQTAALHTLLVNFLSWNPLPPNSPQALADILAPLCRLLREDVLAAVQRPDSNLAQLAREWRQYLFPDADDAKFADAYAQTLTYALLLARLNGEQKLTTVTAANDLDSGHGLLAQALRILSQPAAREEIAVPVDLLERMIGAVDPAKLQKHGDPWLYFYEDFLGSYDRKLRNSYGVYYTPLPVIGAQVRIVAELLRDKFQKPLAYADDDVVFLDPGAGTSAYPLAAIEHSLALVEKKYGAGMFAAKATECAKNIHAFEILVGPYAVSHLRLTQLLQDRGATLPPEGIHVYLTDTLESPYATPPQPPLFAKVLTEEHRRAQAVKNKTRVLVCMGNPPYDREQKENGEDKTGDRKGGWVRYGDKKTDKEKDGILQDFIRPASEAGAGVHVKNLYNDYIYFWRWSLWKLFENPDARGPGIISFITASSYLRGPGFVGMRQKIREAFDELWILDLEGDQHGARKTENVFAIQTPVAIAIGVRYGAAKPETPAKIRYAKLTGTREEKLKQLDKIRKFADVVWQNCMSGWQQPFLPEGEGNYQGWPLLTDLFPWQYSGVQFKRTWPIGETRELLQRRWSALLTAPAIERGKLMRETGGHEATKLGKSFLDGAQLPAISSLPKNAPSLNPTKYAYRSFDRQWILPDVRFCDRPRPALWVAHSDNQIYITSLLTKVLGLGQSATATSLMPDLDHFCNRGGKDVIPLWRDTAAAEPNVTKGLLAKLGSALKRSITAEDFLCYAYTLLATPAYVETFSEELTIPGPRLPVTKDANLFARAIELGRRLIWLHTYGERMVPPRAQRGEVPQGRARCKQGIPTTAAGYPEKYEFDADTQTLHVGAGLFAPVAPEVFNFSVSGFHVVESWLSYRMKSGAGRSSSLLDEIRPENWTAAMTQELLELLWMLEATLALYPELKDVFDAIIAGKTFRAAELPQPTATEHEPPSSAASETSQQELPLPKT